MEFLRYATNGKYVIDREETDFCDFDGCLVAVSEPTASAIYFLCSCAPLDTREGYYHEDCFADYLAFKEDNQ